MQIALVKYKEEARNGYLNVIDHQIEDKFINFIKGDYLDFTDIVYDGEADEVYIPSLIEYIPQSRIGDYIKKWIAITSIGGIISVGGTDLLELTWALSAGKLNETQLNAILFSNDKKGCYSTIQVMTELKEMGLEIEKATIDGFQYLVTARRVN